MAVFFVFFFQTAGQASIINSQNLSCRNPVRSLTFSICKIIYMPLKKDYNNQKFQKPFYQIAEYHSDRNEKEGKSNYTLQTTSPPKKTSHTIIRYAKSFSFMSVLFLCRFRCFFYRLFNLLFFLCLFLLKEAGNPVNNLRCHINDLADGILILNINKSCLTV